VGSIGIQIGGLSALAPNRRADLSRLALRAMIAGTLAANATACVAALMLPAVIE
jgi:CNT family concentrative nucleoside transporter